MHEDVLAPGVAEVARRLSELSELREFYLAGGTALALQLGHRRSRDLDFLTRQPAEKLPLLAYAERLRKSFGRCETIDVQLDQAHFRLDGVSVTLLAYPFRRPFPDLSWAGLYIADVRTVAVQQAYTIGRRPAARDYIDIAAVLRSRRMSLKDIVNQASAVFGNGFSTKLLLQQLVYTRDLPDVQDALTLLMKPEPFTSCETFLQQTVESFMKTDLRPRGPRL